MGTRFLRLSILYLLPVLLYLGLAWWLEIVRINHHSDHSTVTFVFLTPMNPQDVEAKLSLRPEQPQVVPAHRSRWLNSFVLAVDIYEPKRLRGQQVIVQIDRAATRLPLLKKTVRVALRRPVRPALYDLDPVMPSKGPLEIRFDTPLRPETVPANILITLDQNPVKGDFKPRILKAGGAVQEDRATWLFWPEKPVPHDTNLEVCIGGGITSAGGLTMNAAVRRIVRTAPALKVVQTAPGLGATGVDLHPEIQAAFNQPLSWGWMNINGVRGRVDVWANQIQFTPLEPLMPDQTYTIHVRAVSRQGEQAHLDWHFATLSLGDKLWVAVDLEGEHNVTVFRGNKPVHVFKASGGKVTSPTPLGTYFLYNRGYAFWNQRLQEGAYYWVQFKGPYLVHSVPFDASGKLKQEEIEKLGQAASHGCIRLSLEDAKWFFHHVPNGTMIVIYNQH
jgi:hypothetical protein